MDFKKYMHVEKFGTDEVKGIEIGECHIFPKLDGTNASIWLDDDGNIAAGSRKRVLSVDNDNAGFCAYVEKNIKLFDLLHANKTWRVFGEWLVPHTLKTYREDAWQEFYVFDVFDGEEFIPYESYAPELKKFGVSCIPLQCVINMPTEDLLKRELQNNTYLLLGGGLGLGEGIVIKNYNFTNRFGRTVWAKMITNKFREKHSRVSETKTITNQLIEQKIVERYVTPHLVHKVFSKIVNDVGPWNSKLIPRLLNTVWYDLIKEDTWEFVKRFKNPTVDFRKLQRLTHSRIKDIKSELF